MTTAIAVRLPGMTQDARLTQLEREFSLLRSELIQMKKMALEQQRVNERLDVLRSNEKHTLQSEVEHLRIENSRLRADLAEQEEVTPALPRPGKREDEPT